LEYLDKLLTRLPEKYHKNNEKFRRFVYDRKKETDDCSAEYNPDDLSIRFLDAADDIDKRGIFNYNNLDTNFSGIVYHEIGHPMWAKIEDKVKEQWGRLNGWDADHTMKHATGKMKDIKKQEDIPSITGYAKKSANEAFAEYTAIYLSHKKTIDKILDNIEKDNESATKQYGKDNINKINYIGAPIYYEDIFAHATHFKFLKDQIVDNLLLKSLLIS